VRQLSAAAHSDASQATRRIQKVSAAPGRASASPHNCRATHPNLSLSEERSAKAAQSAVSPGEVQRLTSHPRRLV